jgi:hypothetical protein
MCLGSRPDFQQSRGNVLEVKAQVDEKRLEETLGR